MGAELRLRRPAASREASAHALSFFGQAEARRLATDLAAVDTELEQLLAETQGAAPWLAAARGVVDEHDVAEMEKAAVSIQSKVRGNKSRKEIEKLKKEIEELKQLQEVYPGDDAELQEAAKRIQSRLRGNMVRREASARRKAGTNYKRGEGDASPLSLSPRTEARADPPLAFASASVTPHLPATFFF